MCEVITARSSLRKVPVFGAVSMRFLFMCELSLEPLNVFVPNSQERRVWSLAATSLKAKPMVKVTREKNSIFRPFRRSACGLCLVKHL